MYSDGYEKHIDNYLKMSLVALLCCFPCGIVALYHSVKVVIIHNLSGNIA